jgi:hypothetical protein
MLSFFRKSAAPAAAEAPVDEAPGVVSIGEGPPFALATHLESPDGFPMLDWAAASEWVKGFDGAEQKLDAWDACERGWLLHLRDALGKGYRLDETGGALLLSSLEPKLAKHTLDFMERTLKRITHVLEGIAESSPLGKDILVVFDDHDTYYRYAAQFDPERGEFAFSSGMHIDRGCSYFITRKDDLRAIEPVIAHEMTHACVQHLPLPLWLNEGLAVNTEQRLVDPGRPLHTPQEMHTKHLAYWDEASIQDFWSGDSYRRTDDGNMLSYDLGRVMVEHLSGDWARFRAFVLDARSEDAGAASSRKHLDIELGVMVAAMLEKDEGTDWAPDPQRWKHTETRTE